MINIIFRYDDYSYNSNTELEKTLFKIFFENKIPVTIGVIPFYHNNHNPIVIEPERNISLNKIKRDILKYGIKSNLVEVAQHGHSHYNYKKKPNAELQGIGKKVQEKLIVEGKELIEKFFKLKIKTFIPPWNRYNEDTIDIIEFYNFENLSAGEKGIVGKRKIINFVPSTCNISEFFDIINNNSCQKLNNQTFIVLLHECDFINKKNEIKINTFEMNLRKISKDKRFSFFTIKDFAKKLKKNKLGIKYNYDHYKIIRFLGNQLPKFLNQNTKKLNFLPTTNYLIKIFLLVILFSFFKISLPTMLVFNFFFNLSNMANWIIINILLFTSILLFMMIIFIVCKKKLYKIYLRITFFTLGLILSGILNLSF